MSKFLFTKSILIPIFLIIFRFTKTFLTIKKYFEKNYLIKKVDLIVYLWSPSQYMATMGSKPFSCFFALLDPQTAEPNNKNDKTFAMAEPPLISLIQQSLVIRLVQR